MNPDEIESVLAYLKKHATCDIQQHPWQAVFGAGFEAGRAYERERDQGHNQQTPMEAHRDGIHERTTPGR